MDGLEKFIVENRDKFNENLPSPDVWDNISKELKEEKAKQFSLVKFLGAASAAIGLILLGIWFGVNFQVDDMDQAISDSSFKDYRQTEQYYSLQVKNYMQQIEDEDTKSNIEEDLQQLDEVYQELRDELISEEIKNKDVIINAMIQNYQVKIGMLEKILEKTKEKEFIKDLKNKDDEKISI